MSQAKPALYPRARVFGGGRAPVYAARTVLDGSFETHSHDFVEIMVIGAGHGVHSTIHGCQPLQKGDACILRPGAWHGYLDCRDLEVFNCCFGLELLQHELAWLHDDARLHYLLQAGPMSVDRRGILITRLAPGALARFRRRLAALFGSAQAAEPDDKASTLGHLLLVLSELARMVAHADEDLEARKQPVHEAVAAGVGLLEAELAHEWTLTELAAGVHLNASYLARLFRLQTGLPPMAYLAARRAEHAATMLLRTDYPVARVGRSIGWPDPNYFARRFRAYFGQSATAFRARNLAVRARPDTTHHYDPTA